LCVMAKKKAVKKKAVKVKKEKVIRTDFNEDLFEKLKVIRNGIADEKGVANFIVLNDNVLKELSYYYPTSKEMFLMIKGVGENKFDEYGKEFLPTIEEFTKEVGNSKSRQRELAESVVVKPKINVKERTAMRKAKVKELIEKKMLIDEMANIMDLTAQTIANYIGRLLEDDPTLDVTHIKNSIEGYNDIVKSFEKHGTEKIGPVYGDFAGMVEYSDIALVRILMQAK